MHRPVFYLEHVISETGFCLLLQVEPTQMGPIERTGPCLWTLITTTSVGFIKPRNTKQQKLLTFPHPESPRTWGLTSVYMLCFMSKIVKNKML
jgi:hypothetical protein